MAEDKWYSFEGRDIAILNEAYPDFTLIRNIFNFATRQIDIFYIAPGNIVKSQHTVSMDHCNPDMVSRMKRALDAHLTPV